MKSKQPRIVYTLKCVTCYTTLSRQAMRSVLISDQSIQLYSSNQPERCVYVENTNYKTSTCKCRVNDSLCGICGELVGYKIKKPCRKCLYEKNNGHLWMFDIHKVVPNERYCRTGIVKWNSENVCEIDRDIELQIR